MPPFADVLQWEHLPFPKSLRDFQRLFPDDAACARWLEGAKWPKGFVCPHCEEKGEPVRLATRPSVMACRSCRKQTSLTVGTVMERTHTPLSAWFWAAYLVSSMTPGISAVQFSQGHCPTWAQSKVTEHPDCCWIETLEGTMRADPGDWIIKGVKGEIYACKPDIFSATYEEVGFQS